MDPVRFSFDQPPLTITQLSSQLRQHIESEFTCVHIQGEISGCKYHSSGHIYFSLKDEKSVLDAICWRGTPLPLALQDGMHVVCQGRLTTYGGRSKYQIIVQSLQHQGQGTLLQLVEQLKAKLLQEGLFDQSRKKPLPAFPRCIGLITSPTGAVIQDMMTRFEERFPCQFVLYPVAVQGQTVVTDVLKALHYFENCTPRPDLLIIARGGGSVEDLWPFHDEKLVRAVASSAIPIISAIGHETDTTLIDYASDRRAPTPTAAAEMALPLRQDLQGRLKEHQARIQRALTSISALGQARLEAVSMRFSAVSTFLEPLYQKVDDFADILGESLQRLVTTSHYRLDLARSRLGKGPLHDIDLYRQKMAGYHAALTRLLDSLVEQKRNTLAAYSRLLSQLSYQKTLERGFSLAFNAAHHVVTSQAQAAQESVLDLHFHDGQLQVKVTSN